MSNFDKMGVRTTPFKPISPTHLYLLDTECRIFLAAIKEF